MPRRERRDARLVPEVRREAVAVAADVQRVAGAHLVALRVEPEHAVARGDVRDVAAVCDSPTTTQK